MSVLARQRCWQHPEREAIARCVECGHSYCRECITEHGERLICAACLERLAETRLAAPAGGGALARGREAIMAAATMALAWWFFYTLGRVLMSIPASYHAERIRERIFE